MFAFFMAFASVGHFALDVADPENTPGPGKAMVVLACLFITAVSSSLPLSLCAPTNPNISMP